MATEEVFEAAKKVYGLYGAFYKVVAQELGTEKALDLHAKAHEEQGIASGKLLKEKIGEVTFGKMELIDIQIHTVYIPYIKKSTLKTQLGKQNDD